MNPQGDGTSGVDAAIEEAGVNRRRRWSGGRIFLNVFVVIAFAGAAFALYTLIQGSGVLDGSTQETPVAFEDVPAEYAQSERILEAVEKGLVKPSSSTRFGPSEGVTRGEFAGVVVRTLDWEVRADETHTFSDVTGDADVVDEADYIGVVATKGVMGGVGGVPPTFAPTDSIQMRHVLLVFARAAGDHLPEPQTPDPAIQALPVSDEISDAYQRLEAAGILGGTGLEPTESALMAEADREQVAVIAVNLHRFLASQ
ncbi:MAG: S-layer homology domain-containing protein [Thermoleophilia bacterium]